jgi:thiosulfate/3-mercaptopyruvate sulfurtransferase
MNSPIKSALVSAQWLLEHHRDADVRVADARFSLGQPDAGITAYRVGHVPGAVFLDLERDLSSPVRPDKKGGRHPLPDPHALAAKLGALGIGDEHLVVAYDDPSAGQGFYAAHLWWLLRYLGHEGVAVLDGGLPAWIGAGGALETASPEHPRSSFTPRVRPEMVVDADFVGARDASTVLIDSRAGARYRGEVEPIDPKAGHIPGARNRDWSAGLEADGRWKSSTAQQGRFADLPGGLESDLIVYCGSGVSATGNLLALEIAGKSGVRLYAGSWSDWVSDETRPVATGEEP